MDTEHLSALRQAATALIATAAASTVLAALRTLLADPGFAGQANEAQLRPSPPPPHPHPAPAQPARPRSSSVPSLPVVDAGWEELRGRVKAAMVERGASYADVAAAIGHSQVATRIAISSRKSPRPIVQTKLRAWLANGAAGAPEVAASGTTFRPNGADRLQTGNGLDTAA